MRILDRTTGDGTQAGFVSTNRWDSGMVTEVVQQPWLFSTTRDVVKY